MRPPPPWGDAVVRAARQRRVDPHRHTPTHIDTRLEHGELLEGALVGGGAARAAAAGVAAVAARDHAITTHAARHARTVWRTCSPR